MHSNSNTMTLHGIALTLLFLAFSVNGSEQLSDNNSRTNHFKTTQIIVNTSSTNSVAEESRLAETKNAIPMAKDFQRDANEQQASNKVILAYVSASYCAFCKKLEKEVILPAIKSGEYQDKIILRKIDWHGKEPLVNFMGKTTTSSHFLTDYNIRMTPTLLFLGKDGQPLEEEIIGYQSGEFYWYYLDAAIRKANEKLQ